MVVTPINHRLSLKNSHFSNHLDLMRRNELWNIVVNNKAQNEDLNTEICVEYDVLMGSPIILSFEFFDPALYGDFVKVNMKR